MKELLEFTLNRFVKKPNYTVGRLGYKGYDDKGMLIADVEMMCNTLEDTVRELKSLADKVPGQTAIPAGKYQVVMSMSPRFKRVLPEILNVPYFTGVRIHRGNAAKNTEGCILPGNNNIVGAVSNSTEYELKICELVAGYKECWITII